MPTRLLLLTLSPFVPVLSAAATPSFDCSLAKSWVEKAICSDDGLAARDAELSSVYKRTTSASVPFQVVASQAPINSPAVNAYYAKLRGGAVSDQRKWLASRERACRSSDSSVADTKELECLREFYALRIEALTHRGSSSLSSGVLNDPTPLRRFRFGQSMSTLLMNGQVVGYHIAPGGRAWRVLHWDPASGRIDDLAEVAEPPRPLYADASKAVIVSGGGREVILIDYESKNQLKLPVAGDPRVASISGHTLLIAERPRPNEGGGDNVVETFDLGSPTATARSSGHTLGTVTLWGDKVVEITDDGRVTVLSDDLQPIAAVQALGPVKARTLQATVLGDDLFVEPVQGETVVFNLSTMKSVFRIPCSNCHYGIDGEWLLSMPNAQSFAPGGYTPQPLTAYDLQTGRNVGDLGITADGFTVSNGTLTTWVYGVVLTAYRAAINAEAASPEAALTSAYKSATLTFLETQSVDDALRAFDSVDTARLHDAGSLSGALLPVATDYASWMAASLRQHQEGLQLLTALAAAYPADSHLQRRLAGAELLDFSLSGSEESLKQARAHAKDPALGTQEIKRWKEMTSRPLAHPINLGGFVYKLFPRADRLFAWEGGGLSPTVLASFDRMTLRPLADYQIQPGKEDNDDNDWISDVTYKDRQVTVWWGSKPEAITIDTATGTQKVWQLAADPTYVLTSRKGVIACSAESGPQMVNPPAHCSLLDANFQPHGAPRVTLPFTLGSQEISDPTAAAWVLAQAKDPNGNALMPPNDAQFAVPLALGLHPLALSDHWLLRPQVPDLDVAGSDVHYLRLGSNLKIWRQANLSPLPAVFTNIELDDQRNTAVVSEATRTTEKFTALDLNSNVAYTALDTDQSYIPAWTVVDGLLVAADGHNLIVYDLLRRRLAGVWENITPPAERDASSIAHVECDGEHIFLRTRPRLTQFDQVIGLQDLRNYASAGERLIAVANRLLLGQ